MLEGVGGRNFSLGSERGDIKVSPIRAKCGQVTTLQLGHQGAAGMAVRGYVDVDVQSSEVWR
jgi:hypothetical protein